MSLTPHHTPESDKLAAVIMDRTKKLADPGPSAEDLRYTQGLRDAWELITGASSADMGERPWEDDSCTAPKVSENLETLGAGAAKKARAL